jgi:hypothetical protein
MNVVHPLIQCVIVAVIGGVAWAITEAVAPPGARRAIGIVILGVCGVAVLLILSALV